MAALAEPVVSFSSSKDHYTADACVVWCFDDRFYKLLKAFGKQERLGHIDLIKIAGGAQALAGEASPDRDFVAGQIEKSLRLHGTRRIVLMLHRDCGAYGGSGRFTDADAEAAFFAEQLHSAKQFVQGKFPGITVDTYFADFDGLHPVA